MLAESCAGCGRLDGFITDCSEGIIVCRHCGRVKEMGITDDSGELVNFSKEQSEIGLSDNRRVGAPSNPLLLGYGLGTVISSDTSSLSRWGLRVPDSRIDAGLLNGFRTIDEYCHLLHLSQVVAFNCKEIFKKCYTGKKTSRLQSLNALLAAIVYYICRKQGIHKNIGDILEIIPANTAVLLKMYKEVKDVLGLRMVHGGLLDYTEKYADRLKLPEHVKRAAMAIARLANNQGQAEGRNPGIVAATAVYMACKTSDKPISLGSVAKTAKITEATLKSCLKDLMELKDQLAEFLDVSLDASLLSAKG
jgi:transcription initiation factor TFIIB